MPQQGSPTVTVNQAAGQMDPAPVPGASVPIQFTVTFSEPVSGFAGATNKVTWGGTATGISYSITGSGATYTINVTACGAGTLPVRLQQQLLHHKLKLWQNFGARFGSPRWAPQGFREYA